MSRTLSLCKYHALRLPRWLLRTGRFDRSISLYATPYVLLMQRVDRTCLNMIDGCSIQSIGRSNNIAWYDSKPCTRLIPYVLATIA